MKNLILDNIFSINMRLIFWCSMMIVSYGARSQNVYNLLPSGACGPTAPTNPAGVGSFSGKACFDVALGNNNTNSCGPLSARTALQANFTLPATHTQSYTFRPEGTVSNVRFLFVNTNGNVITSMIGNNTGNNISTPVVATANYNTNLNALAAGLTNSNPLTADIYVVYNDGATNNGTDRQLKITTKVKDCACCGAYVSPTVWKEFLCHNLGADISLDPHIPVRGIHGAQIQWGKRGPNTTGDSRVDWQTAANDGPGGFARSPITVNNNAAISGWSATAAANNAWRTAGGTKTVNDPCPAGYRVPIIGEWAGVINNNTFSTTGTWTEGSTQYGSAIHFGPNVTTKFLTLPAAGWRHQTDGLLNNRGDLCLYWSSTENGTNSENLHSTELTVVATNTSLRLRAYSVRCIAE